MPYEFIDYEKKGRIAYVTINRPERLNALHPPANQELYQAFTDFKEDPEVWFARPGSPKPRLDDEKPRGQTVPYEDLIEAWRQERVR